MNIMEINGVLDSIHSGNNKGSVQGSGFVAAPLVEYVSKSTPMDSAILTIDVQGNCYDLTFRDMLHGSIMSPKSFESLNYIEVDGEEMGHLLIYNFRHPFNSKNITFR